MAMMVMCFVCSSRCPWHQGWAPTGEVESRDEVAEKVAALADAILSVAAEAGDPALQRSAAEIFAFAACIGSTPLAAGLLRTLCDAVAHSPSAPRWPTHASVGLFDGIHSGGKSQTCIYHILLEVSKLELEPAWPLPHTVVTCLQVCTTWGVKPLHILLPAMLCYLTILSTCMSS